MTRFLRASTSGTPSVPSGTCSTTGSGVGSGTDAFGAMNPETPSLSRKVYGKSRKAPEEYAFRYSLPVKKAGVDMAEMRAKIKAAGGIWNGDGDKDWYCDQDIPALSQWKKPHSPLDGVVPVEAEEQPPTFEDDEIPQF